MNALVPLHFAEFDVRWLIQGGEPWWVGLDATALLEIARGRQALAALEDYEKGAYIIGTLGGPQEMTIINESGLYSLILRSRKPIAKKFKRWLTTEVLPSIRKHSVYPPPVVEPDDALEAFTHSTSQERFLAECRRLADDHGVTTRELLKHIISPAQLRAIELGHGPMEDLLHRDKRWLGFMGIGMDLQFVLHGIWGQTPRERALQKQMRAAASGKLLLN